MRETRAIEQEQLGALVGDQRQRPRRSAQSRAAAACSCRHPAAERPRRCSGRKDGCRDGVPTSVSTRQQRAHLSPRGRGEATPAPLHIRQGESAVAGRRPTSMPTPEVMAISAKRNGVEDLRVGLVCPRYSDGRGFQAGADLLGGALQFQRAGDHPAQFAHPLPFLDQGRIVPCRGHGEEILQMHAFVFAGKRDSQASSMVKQRMGANQVTMRRKISSITVRAARRRGAGGGVAIKHVLADVEIEGRQFVGAEIEQGRRRRG